jgi:hypothetical protein
MGDILTGEANPHTSVPTIEIQNAQELKHVDVFLPFLSDGGKKKAKKVIVEIKFTTRADQRVVKIK